MTSFPQPLEAQIAPILAARLRDARNELTARWLERIVDRVTIEPARVFPMDDLLDHVPLLVDGIADFLEDPANAIAARPAVVEKAMELGSLRYHQGFAEHEIQKEYEILGGVLFAFLQRVMCESKSLPPDPATVLACSHRLFQAIALIQQATTSQFLRLMSAQLAEREERLEAFHRALAHEMRNRIGATLGAGQLLLLPDLAASRLQDLAGVVVRNATSMHVVLENLLELSRGWRAPRQQRHVLLADAVAEAARQLRDTAQRSGVEVRVAGELPRVEVNAAAVELCLANFLSNAIKYADPSRPERWAEIRARVVSNENHEPCRIDVEVADNGIGVPLEGRSQLFERFYRAHDTLTHGVEGTGLGLSIVRETATALGGTAWARFPGEGSIFGISVPCRRLSDAIGLGTSSSTAAQLS